MAGPPGAPAHNLFPVTEADLHRRLRDEILAADLADNTKARLLQPDGEYVRAPRVGAPFSAQDHLMRIAEGAEETLPEAAKRWTTLYWVGGLTVAGGVAWPPVGVTLPAE